MSENFLISSLQSKNLPQNSSGQEQTKEVEKDCTSIFGTFDKSFLKGITILHSDENIYTPFSREKFAMEPFSSAPTDSLNDSEFLYDSPNKPALEFEC